MIPENPHILAEKRGALGLVTLNRPEALNAFGQGMCNTLTAALQTWATDSAVRAVAIRGAGSRAFCAGGDVRAMAARVGDVGAQAASFLADEYRLNAMIAAFPKPYVALLHGFVMGGGAGLSVHGRYRLADASLAFAMPETAIGFVPDIGASHFLSRCPGETGTWLGLTGARIGLGDALDFGLVTHAVAQTDFDAVIESLATGEDAQAAAARFAVPAPPPQAPRRHIDALFSAATIEAILERLERDGSAFADGCIRALRAASPTALKFTLREIRAGRALDLQDCLKMEYRIAMRAILTPDFTEGVRAQLIDKDRTPRWHPAQLAAVTQDDVAGYFAPLGTDELTFAGGQPRFL